MARNQAISHRRTRRIIRTRAKLFGTAEKPRLAVYRSNEHLSAQMIDDSKGVTLCAVHDRELSKVTPEKNQHRRMAEAQALGKLLAEKAGKKKITKAIFDRRGARFHGRIAAFAQGAREAGLHL